MRAILSCGGTGGHIYPAIAIADRIRKEDPNAQILFIGTKTGMENRLVPNAGYEIKGIDASGIDRKNLLNNFKTAANTLKGSREAGEIIKSFKPDVVIGTGGYVTGSVVHKAHELGIRCYIHEQNAVPGVTNKLLERYVDKLFISFEQSAKYFKHPEKTVFTGNPVRKEFSDLDRHECREKLGFVDDDFVVLAFGGSLGALILNDAVIKLVDEIRNTDIKLVFVTGKRYYESVIGEVPAYPNVRIMDYADNMPQLIGASDIVISRAGAIAVSEITAAGRASILVPSPNVTNNHQYHNAKAIADEGAALLLEDAALSENPKLLAENVMLLLSDPAALGAMAENAKRIGRTNGSDIIFENLNFG